MDNEESQRVARSSHENSGELAWSGDNRSLAPKEVVSTRPDTVDKDTWSGGTVSAETDDVIEARKDRQHTRQMQARVLGGIAGLIVVVLVLVFGSQALHWVSEPFAGRIADLMLPALLASGGTVVGFYFHRGDDHK
jgi:hypothetical protein